MLPLLGIGGAMAGSQKDVVTNKSTSSMNLSPESALEGQGRNATSQGLSDLQSFVSAGPGQQDVTNAYGAQNDFAAQLKSFSQGGFGPTEQDINSSNSMAEKLFGGRRNAITSNFGKQREDFAQQASLMGRSPLDPVFRNKLAQEQTRQLEQVGAEQGSFAMQNAMQQPFQRLQFQQQHANVLGGLATQAMSNRQALMSMGNNIHNSERGFRLNSASRENMNTQESGGGFKGGFAGALGGISAGLDMMKSVGSMGMGMPSMGGSSGPSFDMSTPKGNQDWMNYAK